MRFTVEFTHSANADLNDIIDWISRHDSIDNASHVLEEIEAIVLSLEELPERGTIPLELRALGVTRYREVFFKPYRIIYHVRSERVIVNLIADGRRDMMALLQARLYY